MVSAAVWRGSESHLFLLQLRMRTCQNPAGCGRHAQCCCTACQARAQSALAPAVAHEARGVFDLSPRASDGRFRGIDNALMVHMVRCSMQLITPGDVHTEVKPGCIAPTGSCTGQLIHHLLEVAVAKHSKKLIQNGQPPLPYAEEDAEAMVQAVSVGAPCGILRGRPRPRCERLRVCSQLSTCVGFRSDAAWTHGYLGVHAQDREGHPWGGGRLHAPQLHQGLPNMQLG